jgi:tRNA (guanosine-2'-O-)-methyltransferase
LLDSWLPRYRPDDVVNALGPLLSAERKQTIEAVLARRLAGLTIVLENLHDPHNGAAALRSIEAFGLCELHVVEAALPFRFSSKVTQGCEKWVAIRRHPSFAGCATLLHERGFSLMAAVPGADRDLSQLDVARPLALVFGNEHAGLSDEARGTCDGNFGIPMQGMTRSLNLSVSVAVSLADCSRRRREARGEGDLGDEERQRLRARFYALSLDPRAAEKLVERWVQGSVSG